MGKLTYIPFGSRELPDTGAGKHSPRPLLLAAVGLGFCVCAHAQSATNFDTKTITPKSSAPAKKDKAAVPATKEVGPVSATPSRYVGEADMDAYVEALASVFSIRSRETDPFGQLQDPDAKPVVKTTVAKTARRVVPVQATPFADIIRLIEVKMIMPGEKRFLINTRSFKQGESVPINFRGRSIRAEIMSVTSHQIDFRNLESGETASLKTNILPVGMTPGTKGISAPGMVPANPNSPIELEPAGNPSETNPQNP